MSSANAIPVYFELSWSILSTIGLLNMFIGFMVLGITGFSPIWLVPVVTSAAGATANGLCYYAFYADYPVINTAVASAFADVAWLVQEAGASFYSYIILSRVLRHRSRTVFRAVFWTLMVAITAIRAVILVTRIRFIISTAGPGGNLNVIATSAGDLTLQATVDHLHVAYFTTIALVECACAFFLLREFSAAKRTSVRAAIKTGLFSYLMRSTEIRVALLAVIGVMRAITYSFQSEAQQATNLPSQLDRFAYTLECMFPLIMFIDMLASRVVFAGNDGEPSGSRSRSGTARNGGNSYPNAKNSKGQRYGGHSGADLDLDAYPYSSSSRSRGDNKMAGVSTVTKMSSDKASSQEFIIDGTDALRRSSASDPELGHVASVEHGNGPRRPQGANIFGGISKTVEFEVYEGHRNNRSPA